IFTVIMLAVTYQILHRLFGMRRLDALFSGLPGGLANVIFVGSELGADLRLLSLMHSIRIVLVCFAMSLWFRLVEGVIASSRIVDTLGGITFSDLFWFVVAGGVGYGLALRLRLPAPFLIGPLLLSAALHMAGFTAARPPSLVVNMAQVVVGSAIGCRFVGVSFRRVLSISGMGVGVSVLLLGASALTALGTHYLTGLPFPALLLAFAPGGLPEMTLIALSLNLDVAFVVSHHLARILFINMVFPMLARQLKARWGETSETHFS
ncbi:MAG: AbrB family transcriptional regulator, partial [Deltaproteobacteria bacterium]|nr:AbrB family transcriptional regulator [Deltaproteobacteria bacterium]